MPYGQLGVATSGATLFRSIGGSLGTAILGAVFASRLSDELAARLGSRAGDIAGAANPAALHRLPAVVRDQYVGAFTDALTVVFVVGAAVATLAFLLTWLIEERPLRGTVETTGLDEAFAPPQDVTSLRVLSRELSNAVGRPRARAFVERAAERASISLSPEAIWMLSRAAHGESTDPGELAGAGADPERVRAGLDELSARGLLADGRPTEDGEAMYARVSAARCTALRDLVGEWVPDREPGVDPVIERLADELGVERPRERAPA